MEETRHVQVFAVEKRDLISMSITGNALKTPGVNAKARSDLQLSG